MEVRSGRLRKFPLNERNRNVTAFLVGCALAMILAIGNVTALNALDQSTPQVFYTRYTVPLDYMTPTGGRLDKSPARPKATP